MAHPAPRDNGGLVIGRDAALLVDAGINGAVARNPQALVAKLTDKPLTTAVGTSVGTGAAGGRNSDEERAAATAS